MEISIVTLIAEATFFFVCFTAPCAYVDAMAGTMAEDIAEARAMGILAIVTAFPAIIP